MFGKNPILKPTKGDGNELVVTEIFATIQGECLYSGHPAVFIRLGGCNLQCDFCDTEFDEFNNLAISDIIKTTLELAKNDQKNIVRKLIIITGGEPLRQPIEKLCAALLKLNFKVQIETNGTLSRPLPSKVEIICSPKNINGSGYKKLHQDLLSKISALKFIISNNNKAYNHVPEIGQSEFKIPIYLQPMDEYNAEKNLANLELTKKLAQENGYFISLQIHKILNLP
jgi:organic radical activating enzyme